MFVYRSEVAPQDRRGATEENCLRIHAIDAWEALGYRGSGREEHSGEPVTKSLDAELADNRPEDIAA